MDTSQQQQSTEMRHTIETCSSDPNFLDKLKSVDHYAISLESPEAEVSLATLVLDDMRLEVDHELQAVVVNTRKHLWKNQALVKLCEQFYEKSSRILVSLVRLQTYMQRTYEKLGHLDDHFFQSFIPVVRCFDQDLLDLLGEQKLYLNELKDSKKKIDKKVVFLRRSKKASGIACVILFFIPIFVDSGWPKALVMLVSSSSFISFGMWIRSCIEKYLDVVKKQRETIMQTVTQTQHIVNELGVILQKLDESLFSHNRTDSFVKDLKDIVMKVDEFTNNIRTARTAILHNIVKLPNSVDT